MRLFFSQSAFRQFKKLDVNTQKRIDEKLRFYLSSPDPLQFAESTKDDKFGDWKFRIGDYRVIFDVKDNKIFILKIGHRRDICK